MKDFNETFNELFITRGAYRVFLTNLLGILIVYFYGY